MLGLGPGALGSGGGHSKGGTQAKASPRKEDRGPA